MSASTHRTSWVRPVGALVTVVILAAACVASTPSASPSRSVEPSESPPFSPYVDPNPSPPFSPWVDPNPSPPPSPWVDPNPSPPFSPCVDPNPSPPFSPYPDPVPSPPYGTCVPSPVPFPSPSPSPLVFTGPWGPAGSIIGDSYAPIVALADGRALLVEGWWDDSSSTSPAQPRAQLWDPGTKRWGPAAGLNRHRSAFILVGLKDGRALVAGGKNDDWVSYSSAMVFDPAHGAWTVVGLMDTARDLASAAVLPDGRVLVAGGYHSLGLQTSMEPAAGADLAAFHEKTGGPSASSDVIPADAVETPPKGYALATAELFDPRTGTWTRTGSMRYARIDAPMVVLRDGRVLIVGSGGIDSGMAHPDAALTAEIYDPATGRFSLAGRLPAIDHAAVKALGVPLPPDEGMAGAVGLLVAHPAGGALLVGNVRWWKHEADVTRDFRYDPATNEWRQVGATCAWRWEYATGKGWVTAGDCRSGDARAALPDGRVLSAGGSAMVGEGREQPGPTATARLLDPITMTWTTVPPMPIARAGGVGLTLADGSVLILRGWAPGGDPAPAIRYAP